MNVIINYQQCAIRFSTRPSDEVLRGLRAEGFTWHAPTYSWIRPEGWNGPVQKERNFGKWMTRFWSGSAPETRSLI